MIRTLRWLPALCVGLTLLGLGSQAHATPAFAKKENKPCVYCHVVPGGPRNFRGLYYATHNHSFADFDNEYEAKLAGVSPDAMGPDAKPTVLDYPNVHVNVPPVLRFVMKDIDGNNVNLARYVGKVILIVNTASLCGNTPQYAALEQLYEKYKDKGFVILGFPSNDFGHQEPGDNQQIKQFCTSKYHVTFPMFAKIDVKGDTQAPLYKFLTDKETDPKFGGPIEWNFAKFLIGRNGEIVARFPAGMSPTKPEVIAAIEHQLEQPAPSESTN
ncbi:glutathione peroxidase [Chthonomonas sp.]|uniref:glutathione peroxidase n=1 Tax=Chthonomonas sp. TaxID=2282153 RepID=UPI0031B841DC